MQNQERLKVLEMVAAGKISIEQADQLIELLNAKASSEGERRGEQIPQTSEYGQENIGRSARIRGSRKSGDADASRGLREAGLTNLTVEQVTALKMHFVNTDYIRDLAEAGLADLTVEQIIDLKNHMVSAKYIAALQETGLADLTVEQIIDLKNHMVSAKYIAALIEAGLTELSVEQIIDLKNYMVSEKYIRTLREAGLTDLTIDQIISLNMYRVDPYSAEAQQINSTHQFPYRFSR